jgi:hypothetical protein
MSSLAHPPALESLLATTPPHVLQHAVCSGMAHQPGDRYVHWDQLRQRPPPPGSSHEAWWLAIKLARLAARQPVALPNVLGGELGLSLTGHLLGSLQRIDQADGVPLKDWLTAAGIGDRLRVDQQRDEVLGSAALAGTPREGSLAVARSGSARARDDADHAVINAVARALAQVRAWGQRPLGADDVCALQRLLVPGARPAAAPADLLQAICDLANGALPVDMPLHPAVRGAIVHFVVVDRRPFRHGSGRLGRLLGGWVMQRAGHPLADLLAPSAAIGRAPAGYRRTFRYVASDDRDVTYLVDLQVRGMLQSLAGLTHRARRKVESLDRAADVLGGIGKGNHLNARQRAVLAHALDHPGFRYEIADHRHRHGVTYQTARVDLLGLAALGLLDRGKRGRAFVFVSPADLAARLRG